MEYPPHFEFVPEGRRQHPPGLLRRRALPPNPNGILAHSPRLAPQRLPWVINPTIFINPNGVAAIGRRSPSCRPVSPDPASPLISTQTRYL